MSASMTNPASTTGAAAAMAGAPSRTQLPSPAYQIAMFERATRRKRIPLPPQTKAVAATGPFQWELPKAGFLDGILIPIRATVGGSLSAPNALGLATMIRSIRLTMNSGIDLINLSGIAYFYLVNTAFELGQRIGGVSGTLASTTGAKTMDIYLPIAINQRDPLGLLNLQTEQNTFVLSIEFNTDTIIATGATITATMEPLLEISTVPTNKAAYPPTNFVQRILEDPPAVLAAAQTYTYTPPRGDIYLQLFHGCGIGVTPADQFTRAQMRVQQSDYLFDQSPTHLDMSQNLLSVAASARSQGLIPYDLMSMSGLGNYDKLRDVIDSSLLTDWQSVIVTNAATTVYTVRRMLTRIG